MLLLGRKPMESVIIRNTETHEEIEVKLMAIMNNQIRLGFDAPKHINIIRKEIDTHHNRKEENFNV